MARKKVQDWNAALKGPGAGKTGQAERSMLALEIPRGLHSDLRELAARLGKQAGGRVLLTDLVVEALGLLLAKHKQQQERPPRPRGG
jgi:hypothetical protein